MTEKRYYQENENLCNKTEMIQILGKETNHNILTISKISSEIIIDIVVMMTQIFPHRKCLI